MRVYATQGEERNLFCGENRPSYKKRPAATLLNNLRVGATSHLIYISCRGPDFGQGQTLLLLPYAVVME